MNRTLLISLGAVAAAVLLFVFVVNPLLFGGDDVDEGPVTAADTADGDPDTEGLDEDLTDEGQLETISEESDAEPVPETFEVFTARDPFQQLAVAESGEAIPVADGDTDGGSDGDDADGDADGDGDNPDDGDEGDDEGSSEDANVDGTTVRLEEVFEDAGEPRAQITVNARGYDVAEGDDFASRFRLLDLTDRCATLLYGDQRFTLCEGETIRK